jgi:hypothetical protein
MSTAPISRYPVPELADLPDDLRTRILEVQAKAGFVPNVFLALAHRPAEWRAFMAYHDALLVKDTGSADQGRARDDHRRHLGGQPVPVLRGGARRHPARVREEAADRRPAGHQLPQGRHHAAPARDARLRDEGLPNSGEIDDADFAALRAHGFDDEDIWDIGAITAFFG